MYIMVGKLDHTIKLIKKTCQNDIRGQKQHIILNIVDQSVSTNTDVLEWDAHVEISKRRLVSTIDKSAVVRVGLGC